MAIEAILGQIPLFASFSQKALNELAVMLEPVALEAGQILFYEDDSGDSFYIIVEGSVEIIKALGTTEQRLLQDWGPYNFLGEICMFDMEGGRTATVRAKTQASLLRMGREAFRSLLNRQPDIGFELARQLALRLRQSDTAIIGDLKEKNRQLAKAYAELQAAQALLIEKERLERELQVAREIQESILPHSLPVIAGVDLGAVICPARAVGGDLYDLIDLGNNRLGVVIGDVSDKGVPAAIFMALARSLLRAEASRLAPPAHVLREVNRHLLDMNTAGLFVTAIYGVLDPESRRFTFARAGHEHPVFLGADGRPMDSESRPGQALGLFDTIRLEEQTVNLSPKGRMVLYTDGATDALNPQGERFGRARLIDAIQRHHDFPAQDLCNQILDAVLAFQNGGSQFDDVALVAIAF